MIRVLIADDQAVVRAGLRMILEAQADIDVVGEASDGADAVDAVTTMRPDVALMDIRMPKVDGIEATRGIVTAGSATRVLVLTTYSLDENVYDALRAGASGFLLKTDPPERLVDAVRKIEAECDDAGAQCRFAAIRFHPSAAGLRRAKPDRSILGARRPRHPACAAMVR